MEIFNTLTKNSNLSLALGFFDGVHAGHCCVIKNAIKYAKEHNIKSAVVTFINSPKSFFDKNGEENLITVDEKFKKIEELGIDFLYALDFNNEIAQLSADVYLKDYLIKYLSPAAITTGFNHTFGCDAQKSSFLKKHQIKYNYKYYEIPPITFNNILVSTSIIKKVIQKCDFDMAKRLMGYSFSFEGAVIKGNEIGRTINYPTANVLYPQKIVEIPQGVYCGFAIIDNQPYKGILNYGVKPTISNENKKLLEFHVFNFNKDIYGKNIKIVPLKKIREEQKFASIDELKQRLMQDAMVAQEYFKYF